MTLSKSQKIDIYRKMVRIRKFETIANKMKESGEIVGACHSCRGQEAAVVGACVALRNSDFITGTHRSHGHPIAKGANLKILMAELLGKATGVCKGLGGSMHLADASVGIISESSIVGSGIPLATGAGLTAKVKNTNQVSLCFFGDGAVNEGTFSESINMAAIWKLPVIYFCENNNYAITTSVASSHGQPNIAKRAEGYGIPGLSVDGQDVISVWETTHTAVDRARNGGGPTLIEAKTYRFDEHAMGIGDPSLITYRSQEEVKKYEKESDPIVMFKTVLLNQGIDELELSLIDQDIDDELFQAVAFARDSDYPDKSIMYEYVYSNTQT